MWRRRTRIRLCRVPRLSGDRESIRTERFWDKPTAEDSGQPVSLSQLMTRTRLTCPTVIDSLSRLEELGLVVSTTHQRGKVKTYYVSDPPTPAEAGC